MQYFSHKDKILDINKLGLFFMEKHHLTESALNSLIAGKYDTPDLNESIQTTDIPAQRLWAACSKEVVSQLEKTGHTEKTLVCSENKVSTKAGEALISIESESPLFCCHKFIGEYYQTLKDLDEDVADMVGASNKINEANETRLWLVNSKARLKKVGDNAFKVSQVIDEAQTNFNLSKGDKLRDDEFDNDEVSTDQINHIQLKYRLKKIVDKIIKRNDYDDNGLYKNIDEDEIADKDFFEKHYLEFEDDPFYTVHSSTELAELALKMSLIFGQRMSLNWIDVSHLTDLNSVFKYSDFNGDISKWDVSNVRETKWLFAISAFNGDISKWDVSSIVDMHAMFDCSQFQGDISKWDVSNVRDMSAMFCESSFNGDISNWDVSSVESMANMFAYSEFNQDISKWDVSHVKDHTNFINLDTKIEPSKLPTFNINEAVSNFNLRKDSRLNNDEFDNDDVSADQIAETSLKYKLINIIEKILNKTADNDDFSFLEEHIEKVNEPFYKVRTNADLKALINDSVIQKIHDINWLDVRYVTDMSYMFANSKFNGDISKWDVSNVKNMEGMFYKSVFNGDISNWDVSNVTNMSFMFRRSYFVGDISNWDVSHVTNMCNMFEDYKFNTDISKWDVSNVTNMCAMFAYSYFYGDISNWDVSNVTNMQAMFADTKFNGDISKWNVGSVMNMSYMFNLSEFNQDISKWDVSNVRNMSSMFSHSKFNKDISKWNVSNVQNIQYMFLKSEFNQDISDWNINTEYIKGMFSECDIEYEFKPKIIQELTEAISNFNLRRDSRVNDDEFDSDEVSAKEVQCTEAKYRLQGLCSHILDKTITKEEISYFKKYSILLKNTLLYKVVDRDELVDLIEKCISYLGPKCNLNWIDVSNITDMSKIFNSTDFNGDISEWDVSNVTDMNAIFSFSPFNGNISQWDVSNVEDMSYMFANSSFNGDISKWDVHNVRKMHCMFQFSHFNKDISKWDVSGVTDAEFMFYNSKFNNNISDWDVSHVIKMFAMFAYSQFNQNISNWKIKQCNNITNMFYQCPIKEEYKPKKLQTLSETASNFNLRRDSKLNNDEFDNDEVSAKEVKHTEAKYRLPKIVDKLLNAYITTDESNYFKEHYLEFDNEPFYKVQSYNELATLITKCIVHFGDSCNLNWIDVSDITNMENLFQSKSFNGDISNWDVSNVRCMQAMFRYSQFNGDISKWDVSGVVDMEDMFFDSKFNGDISCWDVSKVASMKYMFAHAIFNGDISKWNISKVANMSYMFGWSSFNGDLSSWAINKNYTNNNNMFYNCNIIESHKPQEIYEINESAFKLRRGCKINNDEFDSDEVSVDQIADTQMKYRLIKLVQKILDKTLTPSELTYFKEHCIKFDDRPFYKVADIDTLKDLVNNCIDYLGNECDLNWIDVSMMTDMSMIFAWSPFNGDISKWDVSNVRKMHCMFDLSKFNGDISNWDVSNVEDMSYMFAYTDDFNQDISGWDTCSLVIYDMMFSGCKIPNNFKPKALQNKLTESVSNFNLRRNAKVNDDEFDDDEVSADQIADTQMKYRLRKTIDRILDGTDNKDDTVLFKANIKQFEEPFYVVKDSAELKKLIKYSINALDKYCNLNWIDVSNITDMSYMFFSSIFDGDISKWDVSHVTNMIKMFNGASFNGDISNWNVSNVIDMSYMFSYSSFTGDISNWNVSRVENMKEMFSNSDFNGDISNWDVSGVTNMKFMFFSTYHFNSDLSKWDISNVEDMEQMFAYAFFCNDISNWKIKAGCNTDDMFNACSIKEKNKPIGIK